MEQIEELHREHRQKHEQRMHEIDVTLVNIGHTNAEIDEKLNVLIGIVDGFIRGKG
jgi:hypothetical protein